MAKITQSMIDSTVKSWITADRTLESETGSLTELVRKCITNDGLLSKIGGTIKDQCISTKEANAKLSKYRMILRQVCEADKLPQLATVKQKDGSVTAEWNDWPEETTKKLFDLAVSEFKKLPSPAHMTALVDAGAAYASDLAAELETKAEQEAADRNDVIGNAQAAAAAIDSFRTHFDSKLAAETQH